MRGTVDERHNRREAQLDQTVLSNGVKLVRFHWEGPFTYEAARSGLTESEYGLYQISAYHAVFGPNSLVYLGKATEQTLQTRLAQHWSSWLQHAREVGVYLAYMNPLDPPDEDIWSVRRPLIIDAEKLLIHWHSPPYNSQHISTYNGCPLRVQNWGSRGHLLPECSSDFFLHRPSEADQE